MSTTRVFTNPQESYTLDDGATVNSSGKLYFREPGPSSTTLKTVYSDKNLTVPLINPVILDAGGKAPPIYLDGDYNVQLTTSADVQVWRVDNYQPPTVEGQFDAWDSSLTYAVNDYIRYTDGKYYVSLVSGNVGNTPSSSPSWWSEVFFLTVYNASETYASGAIVYYSGQLWEARSATTGTTPGTDDSIWVLSGTPSSKTGYINTSFEFIQDAPVSIPAQFSITSAVPDSTYQTIGPSGSGADNVYPDYTPGDVDNAKFAIFDVSCNCSKNTGTDERFVMSMKFRKPGSASIHAGPLSGGYGGATHGDDYGYGSGRIVVPIDEDGLFEVFWSSIGSPDFESIDIRYIGVRS